MFPPSLSSPSVRTVLVPLLLVLAVPVRSRASDEVAGAAPRDRVVASARLKGWAQLGEKGAAAAEAELARVWGTAVRRQGAGAKGEEAAAASKVLVVTEGNFFLEKAVEASPAMRGAKVVPPNQYRAEDAAGHEVILFDRWTPPAVPDKAHLIFLGAVPPGADLKVAEEKGVRRRVKDVRVADWSRDYPLLRGLDLKKLYVAEALELQAPEAGGWDVLVRGEKGPLVVAKKFDQAWQIVVAFDVQQSNWPLQTSFVEFLHRSVERLTGAAVAARGERGQAGVIRPG